jgi:site-specific recombinase XerD
MDDISVLMIREYLATRSDHSQPLFLNHCKKRMTANGVRHMLTKLSEETGIENVHPHRFRRTMITRLLNRGMPIQEVAIIAGHEKVDTTMRYFSSNKTRIKNSYRIYTA